jgi:hypothetical protein
MFTSTQSENPFKVFGAKIHMENIMFCWSRAGVAQIKYIYLLDRIFPKYLPLHIRGDPLRVLGDLISVIFSSRFIV